jgi:hypothetical protein
MTAATITFLRGDDRRPQIILPGDEVLENAIVFSRKLRLYQHGNALVRIENGEPVKVTSPWLRRALPTVIGFVKIKQGKLIAANVPPGLASWILSARDKWTYPTLRVLAADKREEAR